MDELLQSLEAAFGNLPLPTAGKIVYDNSGYHLECNDIKEKFAGRHWRDLTIEDLAGEADALAFFTPEAFQFFLPAFIKISVVDPVGADLITDSILWSLARPKDLEHWAKNKVGILEGGRQLGIPEAVLKDLEPSSDDPAAQMRKDRISRLTPQQKEAIRCFVSFLRDSRGDEFIFGELDLVDAALGG